MKFQFLTTSIVAVLSTTSVSSQEASSSLRNGRALKGDAFPQQLAEAIEVYKEGGGDGDSKAPAPFKQDEENGAIYTVQATDMDDPDEDTTTKINAEDDTVDEGTPALKATTAFGGLEAFLLQDDAEDGHGLPALNTSKWIWYYSGRMVYLSLTHDHNQYACAPTCGAVELRDKSYANNNFKCKWKFSHSRSIRNVGCSQSGPDKVMDVMGNKCKNGSTIGLYASNGQRNQHWVGYSDAADGTSFRTGNFETGDSLWCQRWITVVDGKLVLQKTRSATKWWVNY